MKRHDVRVHPSRGTLPREGQLAWQLARVASDPVPVDAAVEEMIANRIIDNAAVAIAAINRAPVTVARAQALAHPREGGATILGLAPDRRCCAEWAAWANGTAVRELDMHDTFLAADYSHPGDTIPPLLAVAQQLGRAGGDLARGIAAAYEIQVALVKGICLHAHRVDHIAHLGPAVAGGLGALLGLETEVIYQAIQPAAHVSISTRQSRKGDISSWKAFAPAHVGKLAVEAVDRAMRGERSPSPIYEGEDSIIAALLDGPGAVYEVSLPEPGELKLAVLETFTKEHSAEYQAQAFIDLAFELRAQIPDPAVIDRVILHTSHHTHQVIGSGSNDPQKLDPDASRETLDHSLAYIFAVALEDGAWHHLHSYAPERARRESTVRLWHRIETVEDPSWTARYHAPDPSDKAFGGRAEIRLEDGSVVEGALAVANAHPAGARPMQRPGYVAKLEALTEGLVTPEERQRFGATAQRFAALEAHEVAGLNLAVRPERLAAAEPNDRGIF